MPNVLLWHSIGQGNCRQASNEIVKCTMVSLPFQLGLIELVALTAEDSRSSITSQFLACISHNRPDHLLRPARITLLDESWHPQAHHRYFVGLVGTFYTHSQDRQGPITLKSLQILEYTFLALGTIFGPQNFRYGGSSFSEMWTAHQYQIALLVEGLTEGRD